MTVRILVEGRPGSGKSTVAARLADVLAERGVQVHGFVTLELREGGRRVGFAVETIDGARATLAHVGLPGPPRVGRYGVDLDAFETLALHTLAKPPRHGVLVIDELGKMELASKCFRDAVLRLFDAAVDLVATVHLSRHPFTDRLKQRDDVELVRLTRAGRDELPDQLADKLSGASAAQ
jgi:nucleoside-triphosphatase